MTKAYLRLARNKTLIESVVDVANEKVWLNRKEYRVSDLALDVPVSGQIFGVLFNYRGAYEKFSDQMTKPPYLEPPKAPILYIKPINTINNYNGSIPLPNEVSSLEVGATLGVVIGRTATKVKVEEAFHYIKGYTVVNDITISHASYYRPAIKERARDGFCPIGPWIIAKEEIENPNSLALRIYVNDQLVQSHHTKNFVRPIEQLIATITEFMTLYPGDLLLTGVPENAPRVSLFDRVRIEIEQVGMVENIIIPEEEWIGG